MATDLIQRITLETTDSIPASRFPRHKEQPDEAICLYTAQGKIIYKRSAVTASGSSWHKLLAKLYEDAPKKGLNVEDLRHSAADSDQDESTV